MKGKWIFLLSVTIVLGLLMFVPPQHTLAADCTWTGAIDSAWATTGNWSGCNGGSGDEAPLAADNAIIPDVVNDPIISTDVTITNLTIQSGGFLSVSGGSSSLTITGDFVSNGTYTAATGRPTTFAGATNQTVSGMGTTNFGLITINNSGDSDNNIVEIMPAAFSADSAFLTLTDGVLKLSGNFSLSNPLFPVQAYVIPIGTGIWLNNPNVTITPAAGTAPETRLTGSLQITAGTYNVGNETGEGLEFTDGATLIIDGGTLNVAGRFAAYATPALINFTISAGTFTVGAVGDSSGSGMLDIRYASPITITGGTIVIQNPNSGTGTDFAMLPTIPGTITGGTIQFGNASTSAASPAFEVGSQFLPGLSVVDNGSNTPTLTANMVNVSYGNTLFIGGNLFISSNSSFSVPLTLNITVSGNSLVPGDWTNDGAFSMGTGTATFDSASGQIIGGSSATTFYNLIIDNSAGVTLGNDIAVGNNMTVNEAALFDADGHVVSVTGSLTNNGRIRQTADVSGNSYVTFYDTGGYGGLTLNANNSGSGTDLGTTTVTIAGNQDCDTNNSSVRRCFEITPTTSTGLNAQVIFYYAIAEENSEDCSTMAAYRWNVGASIWEQIGTSNSPACGVDPESLSVSGVTDFSKFALSSGGLGPTAVTISNVDVSNPSNYVGLILAVSLVSLIALGLFVQKRKRI